MKNEVKKSMATPNASLRKTAAPKKAAAPKKPSRWSRFWMFWQNDQKSFGIRTVEDDERQANLERKGLKIEPTPGMTATVEIRTGQKTVLEYLFRPLQNVSQALRER